MDPSTDPNQDRPEKPKSPSSSHPKMESGSLDERTVPHLALTPESLRSSDRDTLQGLVESALGSVELLNAFIDHARTLCEDKDESLDIFRDRVCSVLANCIGQRCCSEPMRSAIQLDKLLTISDNILDAIDLNPNEQKPVAINELLSACITLASKLDEHRNNLENLHASTSSLAIPKRAFIQKWKNLYSMCLYQVTCGLEMPGYTPTESFRKECTSLLTQQLSWHKHGLGPVQSENAEIAEVWGHILSFAETLGDNSFHAELLSIAEELIERGLKTEPDIEILRHNHTAESPDNRIAETLRLADALDECERRALGALLECQFGCESEGVWKRILDTKPYRSSAVRTALVGLSHLDASEAAPYLIKMLSLAASPKCPENVRARLIASIENFLEEPAAPQVFLSLFDQEEFFHIERSAIAPIIAVLTERLEKHHGLAPEAQRALSKCGKDQNSRDAVMDRYEERGVIWEPRVLAVLDHLINSR